MKLGIIGAGNMGGAILESVYRQHTVLICEADKRRASRLVKAFKVKSRDLPTVARESDALLLAVKPQSFGALLPEVRPFVRKNQLIISIAAGITTKAIERQLGAVKVIRCMPNMPAQIGEGVTALCKGKNATAADLKKAAGILKNVGRTVEVKESLMDAVTAVSGSGPAYVFLFAELMQKAAVDLGLTKKQARELVIQTLSGSAAQLQKTNEDAGRLREKVTSKGGTTAAALKVFSSLGLEKIVKRALKAAAKRSKELAQP